MRSIEISAKTIDLAIDKGLQMLGATKDMVDIKVICEGSMLKKATIEMVYFENEKEKNDFLGNKKDNSKKKTDYKKTNETYAKEKLPADFDEKSKEVMTMATDFLYGLLKEIGLNGEIKQTLRNGDLCISISGENMGQFIGYHGENLEAVQFLLNTIIKNNFRDFYKKIYIDVENYRRKRQETVEDIASKLVSKVLANKQSIKLEPMNSFERKAIHNKLQNIEHIDTHSEGIEPNRCLVIDYVE